MVGDEKDEGERALDASDLPISHKLRDLVGCIWSVPAGPRGYSEMGVASCHGSFHDELAHATCGTGRLIGIPGAGDWGHRYLPPVKVPWLGDFKVNHPGVLVCDGMAASASTKKG